MIEQTASFMPDYRYAVRTSLPNHPSQFDTHASAPQEFPAVWVNQEQQALRVLRRTSPWTGRAQ